MDGQTIEGYHSFLKAMESYRNKEKVFSEISQWIRASGSGISAYIQYEKGRSWPIDLDNWLEYIEYIYPEENHYELTCELINFIENLILSDIKFFSLPRKNKVIQEHFNL